MSEKYMTKQTIEYSDGTETVLNFNANGQQEEIETVVAEAVAETSPEEVSEEIVEETEEEVSEEIAE